MGRRLGVALVVACALVVGLPSVARAGAVTSWVHPVRGAVVRPFDPPQSRFGAGHLGVDLAAPRGTPVRAAGSGIVSFAGRVAGALHVVVAHAGGLRTSYSYLASVAVHAGHPVAAGDVVGTTGGTGPGHDGSVVHFGLRSGDTYLDPMGLFRPVDLADIVHLAPTSPAPRPQDPESERRGLLAGLAHGASALGHAIVVGVDAAGHAETRAVASEFAVPAAAVAFGSKVLAAPDNCDSNAPAADGEGGSGHRVMLVAGIESSLTATTPSLALPAAKLGYEPGEVTYFSYSGRREYGPADTEGPIMDAAYRLADQLRAMERGEPGREVDLLAHSQGGVVVEAFLTLIYKRDDASYPPLGTVVTLSSPLRGDPLASAESAIARHPVGSAVLRLAGAGAQEVGYRLPVDTPALSDLAADSNLMRRLDAARLPDEVEMTTIGAATDVIVPAANATRPDARGAAVLPHTLNAHTGILVDPSALRIVRAALEDKPLPCQSIAARVAGKFASITISTLEERAGSVGDAVSRLMDGSS